MKFFLLSFSSLFAVPVSYSQVVSDTIVMPAMQDSSPVIINTDTVLRIRNLNPYFTIHVDSTLEYPFEINMDPSKYFWYLRNSPVGVRIDKDKGILTFKADKSYFLSGRLKYDVQYKVNIGVQNLFDPSDKVDTSFTMVFYSTEIVPSRVRTTIMSPLHIEEGDTVRFDVMCENGNFPIETLSFESNIPLAEYSAINHCGDEFKWGIPYDFVKESDSARVKLVYLKFIGTNKFYIRDTAVILVVVKDAINYPLKNKEYEKVVADYEKYVKTLKYTFKELDRKIKKTKNTRLGFEMTTATTALGGTVFSSLPNEGQKTAGKILPSVGVALVPMKEAVAPQKVYDQNSASQVRSAIKRMEYILADNALFDSRDPDIIPKTQKLKTELKQTQLQLIDIAMEDADEQNAEELDRYFNNPKVNKKYRLRGK